MGFYFLSFMRPISGLCLISLNVLSTWEQRVREGHNWEKHFIGLFHVSELVDHFKAIQYLLRKEKKKSLFFKASLNLATYLHLIRACHAIGL